LSKNIGYAFPGQGSQYIGMLEDYFINSPDFNEVFSIAKDVLNVDFKDLIQNGSSEDLSPTEVTQPLLLTANYALWKLSNIKPDDINIMAGHSLGEYSAYLAADSINFEDTLQLVSLRAEFMQEAVKEGEGGIAAIIGLSIDKLSSICKKISEGGHLVSMANINSDNQIVISGTREGVDNAIELCKENGAKRAIPLAMSVPSHCELMKPASIKFSNAIDNINFKSPKTKVIQNFSVSHSDDVDIIKANLVSQLYSPVRWSETMTYFKSLNLDQFIECGPSKVLTGLIKREFKETDIYSLDNFESLNNLRGV
jgi:[acyl-carrier-protein] S-malonyltransferase|tara:strand:+ start:131 stop:1063 length:933 start_codon:yes stop_codon:yes gene_type:complete